ncbi:protein disulfide isomerase, putative [Trypanosoma cruzi marinkellei]|uniref:Protein disulfide isomerase, putative n=1 Tax=Trypanosoma cruzi marinkellei TaxID=85056 RepID=K2MYK4_TRYCR|nr:protein disulfide isomerase, putative [Trypanosoma cruzi marinkellei]
MVASQAVTYRVFLLLFVVASFFTVPARPNIEVISSESQDDVVELHNDIFDAHVFPSGGQIQLRSWFIFFYAPWCAHCKSLLPQFANASRLLNQIEVPHARFAVVNAVKQKELASRFEVHEYPTFIYTTGKEGRWHKFHGGYSLDSFVQFSIYLQRSVEAGSFADIVSDPLRFKEVDLQLADGRVPMFVYVPAKDTSKSVVERQAVARDAQWNIAVDAAASLGNIRFGVLYGDDLPEDWEKQGITSYVAVIEAGRRCKGSGPDGEVFIVYTDAYKSPRCYEESSWFVESSSENVGNTKGAGSFKIHPSFEAFILHHGFRAVEDMTPGFFSVISGFNHHYFGLIVTNGPVTQSDTTMMPVLRAIVQERNEARAMNTSIASMEGKKHHCRISLAHADGRSRAVWRTRYHIELEELPAFVVVDPRRDKVYRLRRHTPQFEDIKSQLPWRVGGEQQRMIAAFLDDVEHGKAPGEKMSLIGDVAEYLLLFPGMEFVYETLGYEDALFITMVLAFAFFSFLLFLALVVEPIMERYTAVHAKTD